MEIIVNHVEGKCKYKLLPYDNGLCWQIWKSVDGKKGTKAKNGHVIKSDWIFTGKYPSTIEYGLELIYNMMMMDSDDKVEFDSSDAKALRKFIRDSIKKFVDKIEVTHE